MYNNIKFFIFFSSLKREMPKNNNGTIYQSLLIRTLKETLGIDEVIDVINIDNK